MGNGSIFIIHRQLEAIVRIAESLSKMKLQPFATEADVEEALRLFQVSTLDAAMSGSLSGEDGQCCIGLQLPSRSLRRVCVCVCV